MPSGDGHAVLVFPGLGASDISTLALRRFLKQQGYQAHGWNQGLNLGPAMACSNAAVSAFSSCTRRRRKDQPDRMEPGRRLCPRNGQGNADLVRSVITLGTPFTGHPKATNAWRFYNLVSGQQSHDEDLLAEVRKPPAGAHHVHLQQDRRHRRLAVQHQPTTACAHRGTSRCTPATSAWA